MLVKIGNNYISFSPANPLAQVALELEEMHELLASEMKRLMN